MQINIKITRYVKPVLTGYAVVVRHVLIIFDNRVQPVYGEKMSRMVSLLEWAKDEFGSEAPSERVLKKYAKGQMIVPPPMRVGRRWMVDREARFIGVVAEPQLPINVNPKLRRIINDGS